MLKIVGLVSCISAVIPAPVNVTTNASYILATALFYKDARGKVILASGPVPQAAAMAISADVSSRFNNATVRVVPAFNQSESSLNSSEIIDIIKNKYKTVIAIEVQKRLSRNAIVDWWNNLFHKTKKPVVKKRSTEIKEFMESTTPFIARHPPASIADVVTTTHTTTTEDTPPPSEEDLCEEDDYEDSFGKFHDTTTHATTSERKIKKTTHAFSSEEERLNEFFQGNEHSGEKSNPKRLRYFDQFVPNDIYYSMEKKCVNWSDGCSHHAGTVSNKSNLYLAYIKPRFPALPID